MMGCDGDVEGEINPPLPKLLLAVVFITAAGSKLGSRVHSMEHLGTPPPVLSL